MKFFYIKNFDRVYSLCLLSFFLALVSLLLLLFFPLFSEDIENDQNLISLINYGSYLQIFIAMIPVLFTGILLVIVDRYKPPDKNNKIHLFITTLFYYSYILVAIPTFGILYLPSIIFLTGATVSTLIRRKK